MDGERRCGGSAFQTAAAATWKLRRPSCVLVEGTSMSWRSAERRCARPETPATAWDADVVKVGRTVLTDTVKHRDCYCILYSTLSPHRRIIPLGEFALYKHNYHHRHYRPSTASFATCPIWNYKRH